MMAQHFLKIVFLDTDNSNDVCNLENRNTPFSDSEVILTNIENWKKLTTGEDVKTVYQIDFSIKQIEYEFYPGDSIGILPQNDPEEVNELLLRLNLESECNIPYKLEISKNAPKKNVIPKHIPLNSTLKKIFIHNIDIRGVLKKTFLKQILQYVDDPAEKSKLEYICSPNGSQEYVQLLENHRTLLSFLNAYPSCQPPIEIILQYSSPLNPRYFSIASCPTNKDIISIIFFLVEHENGLKGICTGWLTKLLENDSFRDVKIPFYFRKPSSFRCKLFQHPVILIATGTGIAPFRSFLQYRHVKRDDTKEENEIWLFYGCRYSDRDYLCKSEIEDYYKSGTLSKLITSFSREQTNKIYVTTQIYKYGPQVIDLILNRNASILICGNIKTVVTDVKKILEQCLIDYNEMDLTKAQLIVNDLIEQKRFIFDNWI